MNILSLIREMTATGAIADEDFAIQPGHVYAHLNRCWHSRNQEADITDAEFALFSRYPEDLTPVG